MKKVVFYSKMFQQGFSGGRYCAMFLAEAFACLGYEVVILCQERPGFEAEFESFPDHSRVSFRVDKEFNLDYEINEYEFIVLIPDSSQDDYYDKCFKHAEETNTPLIFMNFESGNWFNEVSPFKKDIAIWNMWKKASKRRGVILSISEEGMKWSKPFYDEAHTESLFDFWYPAINSFVADKFLSSKKENHITTITRFDNKHKGADDFCSLICDELKGANINLISSRTISDSDFPDGMLSKATDLNITFSYREGLTDSEKFKIISESRVFVFPTYFEGFGYPPLECLYVNTPVVTYDLPVLKETMKSSIDHGVFMVPVGNREQLKKKVIEIYRSDVQINTHQQVLKNTKFELRVDDLGTRIARWQEHFKINKT
jgi:glycosyltransferase involved in cell wall biosynthesis